MAQKAPGKAYREGISMLEIMDMFPDDDTARKWIEEARWPDGLVYCPDCGSVNIQSGAKHPRMTHRCRDCKKFFSAKTGTVMQSSKLGYRVWAIAIYLVTTNLKGVSSMKLHRDLGVTQKTAWHLAHRLRKSWEADGIELEGPVEVDETYVGGIDKNKPKSQRVKEGRGPVNKTGIIGAKERDTGRVKAEVIDDGKGETLKKFVRENIIPGATLYTDENRGYVHLGDEYGGEYKHESVKHSAKEYVDGMAHTNGIESFWSLLKRGYHGTYHKMSKKHLQRYVNEFAGRHNLRPKDTLEQMKALVYGMNGKRLKYKELISEE